MLCCCCCCIKMRIKSIFRNENVWFSESNVLNAFSVDDEHDSDRDANASRDTKLCIEFFSLGRIRSTKCIMLQTPTTLL